MVATKLDGTAIAKSIRERIGREIAERQKLNPRYRPSLKIVQGTLLGGNNSCMAAIMMLQQDWTCQPHSILSIANLS